MRMAQKWRPSCSEPNMGGQWNVPEKPKANVVSVACVIKGGEGTSRWFG